MATFAGSVCKMFFAEASARILFTEILQVVGQAAMDGEDLTPALSVFHTFEKYAPTALDKCNGLSSIRQFTDLRTTLYEVVVVPLSEVLGHRCRVRMWVLPDGTNRYLGLVSFNMGEPFRLDFEAGRRLPTEEAPYEELHDAECLLLKYQRVKTALRTRGDQEAGLALEWYENNLRLGSLVPETYTWHFPRIEYDPTAGSIVLPNAHNRTLWALSFDVGIQNGVCDQVILRMLDRFIRAVGPLLPMELETLSAAVQVSACDDNFGASIEVKPVPAPRTLLEEVAPLTAQLPEDIAVEAPITDSELWSQFKATFDCIPCPYPQEANEPQLWVYSAGDLKAEVVSRWVQTTRAIRRPDTALIVGLSGTGKTSLVTSLLGHGGRPSMVSWPVGDDPRQANVDAHGAEKNYYPNSGERVSIVEDAGEGVVFVDEFLSALARDKGFDLLKAPIEDMRAGRPIRRLPAGRGKRWHPRALIVFAGTPAHYVSIEEEHSEWIRRFGQRVTVPGWCDLESSSRAVILRWCILQEMAKKSYTRAAVHVDAFHWLVLDPQPPEFFEKTNMSGIRNIVEYAGTLSSIDDGELRLAPEQISDHIRDAVRSNASLRRRTFGDRWLYLGEGSAWEGGLPEREQLVLRLARGALKRPAPEDMVSKESLWSALRSIESETDVYNTAYLFCAAVRCIPVEKSGGEDPDPYRTACNRYQDYFDNKAPWLEAVKKYLPTKSAGDGATLSALKIRGPAKGYLGDKFEQHVLDNARQIQAVVERLACAYPPFFHIVPYWNYRRA